MLRLATGTTELQRVVGGALKRQTGANASVPAPLLYRIGAFVPASYPAYPATGLIRKPFSDRCIAHSAQLASERDRLKAGAEEAVELSELTWIVLKRKLFPEPDSLDRFDCLLDDIHTFADLFTPFLLLKPSRQAPHLGPFLDPLPPPAPPLPFKSVIQARLFDR